MRRSPRVPMPSTTAALAMTSTPAGVPATLPTRRSARPVAVRTWLVPRVYVTMNVAVSTDELPRVLELARRAWVLGADALIIQDWGLLAEVRRTWPQIETHVSTQANVHDARGVAWCRDLGVNRVTLSRELSLPEIARISQEGVELECFGHGALCFCYSGVCR